METATENRSGEGGPVPGRTRARRARHVAERTEAPVQRGVITRGASSEIKPGVGPWVEPTDVRPRILVGHVLEVLQEIPDDTVHAVVTSPPYWGLRTYGTEPQIWGGRPGHPHTWSRSAPRRSRSEGDATSEIERSSVGGRNYEAQGGALCRCGAWRGELGAEPTPDLFVSHLGDVFDQVLRVLRPDGALWLDIGDTYNSASPVRGRGSTKFQRAGDPGYVPYTPTGHRPRGAGDLKPKDLVGIPWLVAFELRRRGWYLRSDSIWAKPNPMPESVRDRPTRSHEYVFLLTKRPRYYWDADAGSSPLAASTLERAKNHYPNPVDNPGTSSKWGPANERSFPLQGRGVAPSTARQILEGYDGVASKEYGPAGAQDPSAVKRRIIAGKRRRLEAGESIRANLHSVWGISTEPYRGAHFATFPRALVETCLAPIAPRWGTCRKCGAPYRRGTHRQGGTTGIDWHPEKGLEKGRVKTRSPAVAKLAAAPSYVRERTPAAPSYVRERTPAAPSCRCDAPSIPALVLDPFAGSGTVLEVARSWGLRSVGIELNEKYAALARERAGQFADLEAFP